MLAGLFRPALLLPSEDYGREEAGCLLRHELTHWRSRDLLWKLLLLLANAVHWFNPAVWLLRREANQEIERACDKRVVQSADMKDRIAYGNALLSSVQKGRRLELSTYFYGGKRAMKERFRNILSGERRRGTGSAAAAALLAVLALALVSCSQRRAAPSAASGPADSQAAQGSYSVLVLGTAWDGQTYDAVMLASYGASAQKLSVVSIPRDTYVDVPFDSKRLGALCGYYGGGRAGIDATREAAAELAGFTPEYTVAVDCAGAAALVDAVGGVSFDVPLNMDYDDPAQSLSTHLGRGPQALNGAQAAGLLRWRLGPVPGEGYPRGDPDRVETQKAFAKAMADQLLQPKNTAHIGEIAASLKNNVTTDLTAPELLKMVQAFVQGGFSAEDISFSTLPGETGSEWSEAHRNHPSYYMPAHVPSSADAKGGGK